jgi:hypothetical protein
MTDEALRKNCVMSALALIATGSQTWLSLPEIKSGRIDGANLRAAPKGAWHEINWSPGFSIHTVVTREARGGERSCASTHEGGRYQVSCKSTKKNGRAPVEAEGTVNDA